MRKVRINEYGKEKLKNLAKYEKRSHYPVVYQWAEKSSTEPKKYVLYFAVPDDLGNVFTIPNKWCEEVINGPTNHARSTNELAFELNDKALKLLSKVGKFDNEHAYHIIDAWHDKATLTPEEEAEGKRRYDIWFAILSLDKKVFIVQSTWGAVIENDY